MNLDKTPGTDRPLANFTRFFGMMDGSIESLEESLRLVDLFGEVSGLRFNCGKTEALWIGAKVNSDLKLCPENNFKWLKGKVKALGFWFSSDSNIAVSHNYKCKK